MRTSTARRERSSTTRRPTTSRLNAPGRGTGRGTSRMPARATQRGLAPRRPRGQSPLFGILSIGSFALFWIFLLLAFNSLMVAAQHSDAKRFVASGILGLLSFVWPIAGGTLGVIGVTKANSQKIVAGIGLGLNGLLLLWILTNMARH